MTLVRPVRQLDAARLTLANTGETDHMPFVAVGLPAFTFIQDPIDYESPVAPVRHTNLDTGARLLEDDLKPPATDRECGGRAHRWRRADESLDYPVHPRRTPVRTASA